MNKIQVKSVLAKKITFRFLFVELALFLLVIILLFTLLLPALIRSTTNKCNYISTTIVNLFDNQLHTMSNMAYILSLIHISEPTRQAEISYAVFCLKKKI